MTHRREERDELLDHEVDGIRELDNDLPRWWLYGFYFTIVLATVYFVNYHVLPTPVVGHASIQAEYESDVETAEAIRASRASSGASAEGGTRVAAVLLTGADDLARGRAIYESDTHPCAACHRPDLGGLIGPNLTDESWLHGCSIDDVLTSIRVGFPLQGMLPFGGGPSLPDDDLLRLASYVLSRRGSAPPSPKAPDAQRDVACQ